jgi:2-polyprenyl-3-methyl-5-hydroxy-6-metoxy-1,4-benzoquinol methylase
MKIASKIFEERKSCPGCESKNIKSIIGLPYSSKNMVEYLKRSYRINEDVFLSKAKGVDYVIVNCNKCGLLFQRNQPTEEYLTEIYDSYIDPDKSLRRKNNLPKDVFRLYSDEMDLISEIVEKHPHDLRVLDYASGWGVWAKMGVGWGYKMAALDLSKTRQDHLSESGINSFKYHELPTNSFDLVNCDQIFEHLCSPVETLRDIRRLLADGGLVKISVPHTLLLGRQLKVLEEFCRGATNPPDILAPLEHLNYFTRGSFRSLANQTGFEVMNVSLWKYMKTSHLFGSTLRETAKNIARPFFRRYVANFVFLKRIS